MVHDGVIQYHSVGYFVVSQFCQEIYGKMYIYGSWVVYVELFKSGGNPWEKEWELWLVLGNPTLLYM